MTRSRRGALYPPGPVHIHILGICGTFMGGIAAIARTAGYRVTGCDADVYPPMSTQLLAQGIELTEGYGADQLALKPDLWLIGNVVSRGNPLVEAILNQGHAYVSGPQWLADTILADKRVLAVAGTQTPSWRIKGCSPWQEHTGKQRFHPCWPGFSRTPASPPGS